MYYFGRIIGAFFNQLFRFLFWNKFGQKILIAIIIGLIAFWCLGMTKVHAVDDTSDVNYEAYTYYEGIVNDAISRLGQAYKTNPNSNIFSTIKQNNGNENYIFYFYYGEPDGSSENGGYPINTRKLNVLYFNNWNSGQLSFVQSNYDYLGIPTWTQFNTTLQSGAAGFNVLTFTGTASQVYTTRAQFYCPDKLFGYNTQNWVDFIDYIKNGKDAELVQLLEDIKAEQQATNDFLTEEVDEAGISVQAPEVTDTASENMSSNLHTQINTLTSQLQSTVNNYYEGWNAYVWTIPLPQYIGGNISFDSGVTRRIIGSNGVVFNVIQAIWVILFGGYIVGFIKRMLDWIQTGKIFDEGGLADFIWWMDTNNEIIKASMM